MQNAMGKSESFLKPYYRFDSIGSIGTLGKVLGVQPRLLVDIAQKADQSYTAFDVVSNGGKVRKVFEPKFHLKVIQKRINSRIMEGVEFPAYLMGGIRDASSPRDYVKNANRHAGSASLIKVDIRSFYPSIKSLYVNAVFQQFFRFPPDVSELLTRLTTLHSRVPQGGCASSYLANLIFFRSEYSLVSYLLARGLTYTRLLDDVSISSHKVLAKEDATHVIKRVAAMCRKYDLRLNNKKTDVLVNRPGASEYSVTGLWVKHGKAKVARRERRFVRLLVYICEQEFAKDPSSSDYAKKWHLASGKVAQLSRLNHAQASDLRSRLRAVMPILNQQNISNLIAEVDYLRRKESVARKNRIKHVERLNKAFFQISILGRTESQLAADLREALLKSYGEVKSKSSFWG